MIGGISRHECNHTDLNKKELLFIDRLNERNETEKVQSKNMVNNMQTILFLYFPSNFKTFLNLFFRNNASYLAFYYHFIIQQLFLSLYFFLFSVMLVHVVFILLWQYFESPLELFIVLILRGKKSEPVRFYNFSRFFPTFSSFFIFLLQFNFVVVLFICQVSHYVDVIFLFIYLSLVSIAILSEKCCYCCCSCYRYVVDASWSSCWKVVATLPDPYTARLVPCHYIFLYIFFYFYFCCSTFTQPKTGETSNWVNWKCEQHCLENYL